MDESFGAGPVVGEPVGFFVVVGNLRSSLDARERGLGARFLEHFSEKFILHYYFYMALCPNNLCTDMAIK